MKTKLYLHPRDVLKFVELLDLGVSAKRASQHFKHYNMSYDTFKRLAKAYRDFGIEPLVAPKEGLGYKYHGIWLSGYWSDFNNSVKLSFKGILATYVGSPTINELEPNLGDEESELEALTKLVKELDEIQQ